MGSKLIKYLILFLIIPFIGYSQIDIMNKDSLIDLIPKKKDTALVHLYINIGNQLEGNNTNAAKSYYYKANELSKKINYTIGEIKYINNITYLLNVEGKLQEALTLNKKALVLAKKINNSKHIGGAYANIAASYQYLEQYQNALDNYLKSLKYIQKDDPRLNIIYSNIGSMYNTLDQYENGLKYTSLSEDLARKNNLKNDLAIALTNKTTCLLNLKKFGEANKTIDEVIAISKEINNQYVLCSALLNKGDLLMKTKKNLLTKPYAEQALELSIKLNNPEGELLAYRGLSDYYLFSKNYKKAIEYLNKSLKISIEYESNENMQLAYEQLANTYLAKNDFENFHKYGYLSDSLTDVINLEKTNKSIAEINTKYQTEKKNLQIQNLQAQSKKRFWISIALALGIIGLGGISYSQFKNYKTKKALQLLEQDKAVAEERLRIATDMHDDVGTGLSRIRYITNAVKTGETSKVEGLTKVTEISDDTITKMSEIIWALNESNQTLEELIYFIRSQVSEMVENANLNFNGQLPEIIPNLSFGWMRNRNTYLLAKETINNAIKHAKAKTISIQFEIKDQLIITIKDDGIGFDINKKFNGNGLNNYKKRIEKLDGKHTIISSKNEGTTIVYQIPLV